MKAQFNTNGAILDLGIREYEFIFMALSHLLHGIRISDHDFRNILMMERKEAEALLDQLGRGERLARAEGSHWIRGEAPVWNPETKSVDFPAPPAGSERE